jgi:hypothetical protein
MLEDTITTITTSSVDTALDVLWQCGDRQLQAAIIATAVSEELSAGTRLCGGARLVQLATPK